MAITKPIPTQGKPLTPGKTLAFNDYIMNGLLNRNGANSMYAITAAGTTQATAFQLNSPFNEVDTVAGSTGVNLPNSSGAHSTPYQFCAIYNNGANALTVYAAQGTSDTINGTAGATGVSMSAGTSAVFYSSKAGVWFSPDVGGNESFGAITATSYNGNTLLTTTVDTVISGATKYGSATQTAVSTTTLAPVTGLAVSLTTGGTYSILAELPVSSNASGGVSIAAVASNSLTATSFNVTGQFTTATTAAAVNTTTLGGAVGTTAAVVLAELMGTIAVNTGGTLLIEFAQNASNANTTTIAAGSFLQVSRIS